MRERSVSHRLWWIGFALIACLFGPTRVAAQSPAPSDDQIRFRDGWDLERPASRA